MYKDEHRINGTLVWYYYICPREVWLMSRQLVPDQHDENVEWGRFIHEHAYARSKKEVDVGNNKLDLISQQGGQFLVAEVKKTASFKKSATMQLLYYLYTLKMAGVEAKGELRFPEQKKKEIVELTPESERELERTVKDIRAIMAKEIPPAAKRIKYCPKCAYRELCWA